MQAMQKGDVLEDTDEVVAVAADLIAGCLGMCPTGFLLPMVVEFHQHHLPMVAALVHGGYQQSPT
jgi:hypothetical protein